MRELSLRSKKARPISGVRAAWWYETKGRIEVIAQVAPGQITTVVGITWADLRKALARVDAVRGKR
jgi:hypothetical protein